MRLEQLQRQKQILSQAMQQSLDILQIPLLSLYGYLSETLMGNPVAEVEEGDFRTVSMEEIRAAKDSYEDDGPWGSGIPNREKGPCYDSILTKAQQGCTLKEYLIEQLNQDRSIPDLFKMPCTFLIESLDSKGYLDDPVELLAGALDIPVADMLQALYIVQSMYPTGVGARDLQECLILQLVQSRDFNAYTVRIVKYFLPLLAKRDIGAIAKELKINRAAAQQYCAAVKRLNPIPSQGFAAESAAQFVVPEASVEYTDGQCTVHYNSGAIPSVRLNTEYIAALEQSGEELEKYLEKQKKQIERVQADLENRRSTMQQMIEIVVARQRDFVAGTSKTPVPMAIKDVAAQLSLHPSTVSRAVSNKYIRLPVGIVELKRLFSRPLDNAGTVSKRSVQEQLRQLVTAESGHAPLSDENLRLALETKGIVLSRRSVAAYRAELGIPSARARKSTGNSGGI